MSDILFDWLLKIPETIASFGNWLISPLNARWLNISPLELLSVGGVTFLVVLIGVHIVRLFV